MFKAEPMVETLVCSCCGKIFRGVYDGSSDSGFGTCASCEEWSVDVVVGARIELVRQNLSPERRAKFDSMNKLQQQHVIMELMNRGVIA